MNLLTVLFSAPKCMSLALMGTKGLKWYFRLFCSKTKDTGGRGEWKGGGWQWCRAGGRQGGRGYLVSVR